MACTAAMLSSPGMHIACSDKPVIALCLYGLVRAVEMILPTFQTNVHTPLKAAGGTDLFLHTLLLGSISNRRSGEQAARLSPGAFMGFRSACRYTVEDQGAADVAIAQSVRPPKRLTGDYDNSTLANLLRAAYSLEKVANLAKIHEMEGAFRYRVVVAARPDTAFLTPLPHATISTMLNSSGNANTISVPNFHHWGGVNDRFAIGERSAMLDVYMQKLSTINEQTRGNSELILCQALRRKLIMVSVFSFCVVRIRADGKCNSFELNSSFNKAERPTCMRSLYAHSGVAVAGRGPCSRKTCSKRDLLMNDSKGSRPVWKQSMDAFNEMFFSHHTEGSRQQQLLQWQQNATELSMAYLRSHTKRLRDNSMR